MTSERVTGQGWELVSEVETSNVNKPALAAREDPEAERVSQSRERDANIHT